MMQVGNGPAIAAIFQDEAAAQRAKRELERLGYDAPWLAVVEPTTGTTGTSPGPREHAVTDASDGVLGAFGRFVSGDGSLHRSLVDHGVSQPIAAKIDAAVVRGNAVVVVAAAVGSESVAQVFDDCGGDVYGVAPRGATPPERPTVAGQADDLDRGTGRTHS